MNDAFLSNNICIDRNFYHKTALQELKESALESCIVCDENGDFFQLCLSVKKLAEKQSNTKGDFEWRMKTVEENIKSIQGGMESMNKYLDTVERSVGSGLETKQTKLEENVEESFEKIKKSFDEIKEDDIEKFKDEFEEIRANEISKLQFETKNIRKNHEANILSMENFCIKITIGSVVAIILVVSSVFGFLWKKVLQSKGKKRW